MNWVDFVVILIILLFAFEGLRQGFFPQVFNILGFLTALILSLTFYGPSASLLDKLFHLPKIAANPIGFLAIWLFSESIFFVLFGKLFKKFLTLFGDLFVNRYFGFIPALVNASLFLAFALLFVVSLPIKPDIKRDVYDSKIGSILVSGATVLEKPLNNVFGPIAKQSLTFLTVKPEDKGSIDLQFTQKELAVDFESERIMFKFVNQERVKFGVKPLIWSEDLAKIGRNHSKDMFSHGYFSHYSPEGKDVGDRLDDAGIGYSAAGENLALAPTVSRANSGLINSPGHRRNILDPSFSKIGIGAVDGGVYGKMFTQVFTNLKH